MRITNNFNVREGILKMDVSLESILMKAKELDDELKVYMTRHYICKKDIDDFSYRKLILTWLQHRLDKDIGNIQDMIENQKKKTDD